MTGEQKRVDLDTYNEKGPHAVTIPSSRVESNRFRKICLRIVFDRRRRGREDLANKCSKSSVVTISL